MKSYMKVAMALLTLAALIASYGVAPAQNTASDTAGEEQILIVMSDGTSSVHKLGDQRVKIRTASGESEVPLNKIVYMYRGKARMYSEKGVISGEVLDSSVPVQTDDGATKQIPVSEMWFLSPVQARLSGKAIRRLEIVVADGKVTPTFFSGHAPSATPLPNVLETIGTGNRSANEPAALTSSRISVVILDEYWADRRYTLSNPTHSTVVKKVASKFPDIPTQAPFPVEFDVVAQRRDGDPDPTLFFLSTEKGSGRRVERSCRSFHGAQFPALKEGTIMRVKHDFGGCLIGLEGTGEVYVFVADGLRADVHEKELSKVEIHRTVSNVLRLPVRFD